MESLTMACRHGTLTFPPDAYIGKSLELLGEYSEDEAAFLRSLLKPGDVVVEAGANIGALTVPMARIAGRIFAFEPQTAICRTLCDNLAANGLGHALVFPEALGETQRIAYLSPDAHNCGGVALSDAGERAVRVTTLDSHNLDRLDLLKADVEGMEVDVLLGARQTIARCRPLIYAEDDRAEGGRRLLDTLFAMNYRVWRHAPPLWSKDNFRGCAEDPWPTGTASFNLFAVPAERDPLPQTAELSEVLPGQRRDAPKARWACMVRMGGLGDNLICSSVLPGLKARYGHVEVITREPCSVVFENNPYIDKLTVWPKDEAIADLPAWTRTLNARLAESDFGIHLSHSCEGTLALFEAQTQFSWPAKMRRKLCGQSYLSFVHDICDLPHNYAPGFFPTDAEAARARGIVAGYRAARDAPLVGWVLAGSRIDKAYPGSAAAIGRLLEVGLNVVMFGAPGREFLMAKEIERQVVQIAGADARGSAAGLHLCMSDNIEKPNWPIRRSLSQLQLCDAVVTPDTGPAWSVAMLPMPKVVMVSHASVENITTGWVNTTTLHADPERVKCWPCHCLHDRWETCHKVKDTEAAACIADIPVTAVVTSVLKGLVHV